MLDEHQPSPQPESKLDLSGHVLSGDQNERVLQILAKLETSQPTSAQKENVRRHAAMILADSSYRDTFLRATELAFQRGLIPVAPIFGVAEVLAAAVPLLVPSPDQLLGVGLVASDLEYQRNKELAAITRPQLYNCLKRGCSGGTICGLWALIKAFREPLLAWKQDGYINDLEGIASELSDLNPSVDEARWFIDRARQLSVAHLIGGALQQLNHVLDAFGMTRERATQVSRERHSAFLRNDLGPAETQDVFVTIRRMRALSPLLDRPDITFETIDRFCKLSNASNRENEDPIRTDEIDHTNDIGALTQALSESDVPDIEWCLALLEKTIAHHPTCKDAALFKSFANISLYRSQLTLEERETVQPIMEKIFETYGALPSHLALLSSVLKNATLRSDRPDLIPFLHEVVTIHPQLSPDDLQSLHSILGALFHPSAPPDLVRTYLEAMKDPRFQKPQTSWALLRRLGLHAALYVLPHAESNREIAKNLVPIGALLKKEPHAFLQEEPDADEYRKLQEEFYPSVGNIYRSESSRGSNRSVQPKPFQLLIPPLQRSLGGFMRIADVHHGFGVQAIPSRRTPDGESPLLIRFGLGHGRVSMLNTNDNRLFPGKGFAISGLEPERLFPARPSDAPAGSDPFILYKRAWPTLGKSIERLRNAQFIFTRGMIVIAGVDQDHYSIKIGGARLQYSLVIFNAHFENPFNEVALLVPTELLRDFFFGTLSSLDDYRGFNPNRGNARERIPNPRVFQRHPTLGRYVINVGLPENVLFGLSDSLRNEHRSWLEYRKDAIAYERSLRTVDHGFALQAVQHRAWGNKAAQQLIMHDHVLELPPSPYLNPHKAYQLISEEHRLIAERGPLLQRFESLANLNDPLEREVWACVNRLMELYDLFRIGQAYSTRGMTTPRAGLQDGPIEVELGDAEEAGFNIGGELMLKELYRGNSLHEIETIDRNKFPIVIDGEALYSSSYGAPKVMIDSFDMRGFVRDRPIRFSSEGMNDEDVGVWQAGVLSQIQDGPGSIPELRIVERGMLPRSLLRKLDGLKGG